jgi:hypothetical protein
MSFGFVNGWSFNQVRAAVIVALFLSLCLNCSFFWNVENVESPFNFVKQVFVHGMERFLVLHGKVWFDIKL